MIPRIFSGAVSDPEYVFDWLFSIASLWGGVCFYPLDIINLHRGVTCAITLL